MNCFNHPTITSVATCQDCQKGLCTTCVSRHKTPICKGCLAKRKREQKSSIYKELLLTFVIGVLSAYFLIEYLYVSGSANPKYQNVENIVSKGMLFYVGASLVSGWKTLNRITPSVFLFLPIIGWLFYFIIKFLLSIVVGLFMFPIRLFQNLRRLYLLK